MPREKALELSRVAAVPGGAAPTEPARKGRGASRVTRTATDAPVATRARAVAVGPRGAVPMGSACLACEASHARQPACRAISSDVAAGPRADGRTSAEQRMTSLP